MYSKKFIIALAAIQVLTSFINFEVLGQEQAQLKGQVKNKKGKNLQGVNIFIPSIERGSSSDSSGNYKVENLPEGVFQVTYKSVGHKTKILKVKVKKNKTTIQNVNLSASQIQLEGVTITGSPAVVEPLKGTSEVTVLEGRDKIKEQQASIGQTLEKQAGVQSINTGGVSGKPVIRGLSGNRIRILHNSVAMDYQQYGVRHMPNVDPFLAERIELVQGPASVLYGSGALGGAINFIPYYSPTSKKGGGFLKGKVLGGFQSSATQATGGLQLDGATGGWGFSGGLTYRLAQNITTPNARSFNDPDGKPNDPKFTGELPNTDFEQLNGSFTAGYNGNFGKITANYTRWGNEHNFLLPNGKGLGQRITNSTIQINGLFSLSDQLSLKADLSYINNHRQSNKKGETRNVLPKKSERAHLDILREGFSERVVLRHNNTGNFSGKVGVETRQTLQDTRGKKEPLVPSANIFENGVFALEQFTWKGLTLSAGLRYDYRMQKAFANQKLNLPDSGENEDVLRQDFHIVSGSFGANYKLGEHFAIAANAGRGFRAPSIFELHADGVHGGIAAYQKGTPSLNPETNFNTDLSLKWQSSWLNAKITGYRNAINNYIYLVNTGDSSIAGPPILETTQGNVEIYGAHFQATGQVTKWLQLSAQGEWVQGENVDENSDVDELPLMPANQIGGGIKFMLQKLNFLENGYLKVSVNHVFAKEAAGRYEPFWQFGPAFPFGRASTDAYTLLNASIGSDIMVGKQRLTLDVWAKNILNTAYRDFLDTYKGYALNPGINIGVRVTVPFHIIK